MMGMMQKSLDTFSSRIEEIAQRMEAIEKLHISGGQKKRGLSGDRSPRSTSRSKKMHSQPDNNFTDDDMTAFVKDVLQKKEEEEKSTSNKSSNEGDNTTSNKPPKPPRGPSLGRGRGTSSPHSRGGGHQKQTQSHTGTKTVKRVALQWEPLINKDEVRRRS